MKRNTIIQNYYRIYFIILDLSHYKQYKTYSINFYIFVKNLKLDFHLNCFQEFHNNILYPHIIKTNSNFEIFILFPNFGSF